ncbi:MAG: efflux RND transporter permease subunit [Alphaproteobacteria bacterium]
MAEEKSVSAPTARQQNSAGFIRLFVNHPVAANLLAAILVILGLFSLNRLNTQFFPSFDIPNISVSVVWSGASAQDVEENILKVLEPELRFLDGLEELSSTAREGIASINLEFKSRADMQKALSDVESAVSGVSTLPLDAERPAVTRITYYEGVARLALSGPFSESALATYAKTIRDGLLEAGIDKVSLNGARAEELWIEVEDRDLRRLNLTLEGIADRVDAATSDRPSGRLEGANDRQVRSLGTEETVTALGSVEIMAKSSGERVLLKDFAKISVNFDRDAADGLQNGKRAIELSVQRTATADTLKTARILDAYLAKVLPTLPPTLKVLKYNVRASRLNDRISLLVRNGLGGLVLVLLVLFVFLNARIAVWVAAGIPVAMLATLALMWATGQSINMVSLFALILTLGIIVDDAIVVGEHAATRMARGETPGQAAERAATRMLVPVMAATLTTQAAFFPILMMSGLIGDILIALPIVVITVLTASIVECFLVLPGHLRHGMGASFGSKPPSWFRRNFDAGFEKIRDGVCSRLFALAYRWRYTTVAVSLAALILSAGFMAGGRVGFQFFPSPEPESIYASATFAAGTPRAAIKDAMGRIRASLDKVEAKLAPVTNGVAEKLVHASFTMIGLSGRSRGDNVARISVELTAGEERTVRTPTIIRAWRKQVPKIPGLEQIAISARRSGPPGRDIDIRLEGASPQVLKAASLELRAALAGFPGISAIADNLPYGKDEIILTVTPRGAALGFNAQSVGNAVRAALSGSIAKRFARGDEEITIRVLNPRTTKGLEALRALHVRSSTGREVPLTEIVQMREAKGYSQIRRRDGKGSVAVTADVNKQITSSASTLEALEKGALREVAKKYGLEYDLAGRAKERSDSFADMRLGALIALVLIYIILTWVFGSYVRPIVVMAIIPFGFVGALAGHYLMGFPLTILSIFGLLGLSGILVNNSIILVSQLEHRLSEGDDLAQAAVGAARDRLRAVLLTSLTTIGGLTPLMFEKSLQAQFLLPMAITIVFGLGITTALVLVLVPALVGIQADLTTITTNWGRVWRELFFRLIRARKPEQTIPGQ